MKNSYLIVIILILILNISFKIYEIEAKDRKFPPGFKFGVATSSFQIEGAWNVDGKGENIWDYLSHKHPERIADKSNADVASDSYHLFDEDLKALRELNVDFYRFSISWPRILPNGDTSLINLKGVDYYGLLIHKLREANIEPIITMYHWDLPQALENRTGGFLSPSFPELFRDYSEILYRFYGPLVKYWITFNEPLFQCQFGYGNGFFAPGVKLEGVGVYTCIENTIKAHALAYRVYEHKYSKRYGGKISIALNTRYFFTESPEDEELTDRGLQFLMGIFAQPIFSKEGGYPDIVLSRIAKNSKESNKPRLIQLNDYWKKMIRGTADYFALNYYTSRVATSNDSVGQNPSLERDMGLYEYVNSSWQNSVSHLYFVPQGLENLLKWVDKTYNGVEIFIAENGYGDHGNLKNNDATRISYYETHLNAVLNAIESGCNITGYTAWSLMDNFEWTAGYTQKFGLYEVDFNSPNKTRTPRKAAEFYQNVIKTRSINSMGTVLLSLNFKLMFILTAIFIQFFN